MSATEPESADVAAHLADLLRRATEAARRVGRNPEDVTLLAVGKGMPAERICAAIQAGARHLTENYIQEAQAKIPLVLAACACSPVWHFTGHLQSNKVGAALRLFDVIHTVDSLPLLQRIDRLAGDMGKTQTVLLEVHLGHEPSKSGLEPQYVPEVVQAARKCTHVHLTGLMTIPPDLDDVEDSRPYFRTMAALAREAQLKELSMGMSHDFEVAIEEGATMVRIGRALYGERPL